MNPNGDAPTTRCFLALVPPIELCRAMYKAAEVVGSKSEGVRWVQPTQMHLTLRFFSAVTDEWIEKIKSASEACAAAKKPFDLILSGVGGFPDLRQPQTLWIGVEERHPRLRGFYRGLEIALFDRGIGQEKRSFKPHLTIGRVKRSMKAAKLDKFLTPYKETCWGDWTVRHLTLYRSRLGEGGPTYDILGEWPLGGG